MYENSRQLRIYIATGIVCGILFLIIFAILIILIRTRAKRANYDSENHETYKAYEPTSNKNDNLKVVMTSSSSNNNGKNLSQWLDSLPRSENSPNTTAHEISLDGTLSKRNHTLTKTNPYRHKVLTNGSFLNLKDIPNNNNNAAANPISSVSSDDNSSRPTTSTTDPDSTSEHSDLNSRSYSNLKRSNTSVNPSPPVDTARAIIDTYTGNLFSRSTNYYSFRRNGHVEQDSLEPPPAFSNNYRPGSANRKKRTESVV